jgi:uncharacterized repeat protein (TIGR01451 family)
LDFAVQGIISPVVTSFPDLAVSISHSGDFRQGDNGDVYMITVTNTGSAASAGAITVSNVLPAGLTAASLSGPGWTANLGTLTCSRAENLAPGTAYPPITLVVNVATNAPASITNIAVVSGGGETNLANNVAKDQTVVIPLTPIEFWRLHWFGNADNTGVGANNVVTSGDGIPNILKYAFGLDPFAPTTYPVVFDVDTGTLRLTVSKNPSATDVNFLAETAGSLTSSWSTNGVTIDQNGPSVFQAHRDVSIGSSPSGYMRLSIVGQ